jgi:very-short-patch-repair endonuclease
VKSLENKFSNNLSESAISPVVVSGGQRKMPFLVPGHLKNRARQLRRHSTPAEVHFWEAIRNDRCGGLRFLRQYRIGQYIVDFYCRRLKLAIEIDGCIHEEPEIAERDRNRQAAIELERGIRFLRFTNEQALANTPEQLCSQLLFLIQTSPEEGEELQQSTG